MGDKTVVSVSIVTYNDLPRVKKTLESFNRFSSTVDLKVFVSDNASLDGTLETIKSEFPFVTAIQNGENIGFGKAHNKVIPFLNSKYHVVSNPDIVFSSDVVFELCKYLDENPGAVMVTPKVMFEDGTEQHLQKRKPKFKYLLAGRLPFLKKLRAEYTRENEDLSSPTEIEFSTGCFFVIRTDVLKKLEGFDDKYFMYFEDADISDRAREFGKIIFYPDVSVTHLWERSSSKSIKYLLIHISSMFKYFFGRRKKVNK